MVLEWRWNDNREWRMLLALRQHKFKHHRTVNRVQAA
jgi:hypothetical protein